MFVAQIEIGVVTGVLLGLVFALMSTGFSISYGVARIINFQHGGIILWAMYATFLAYRFAGIHPYTLLVPLTAAAFLLGYWLHRGLVRRSLHTPEDSQVLFAIGLLIGLQYLSQVAFGTDVRNVHDPWLQRSLRLGPLFIQNAMWMGAGISGLALLALQLFLGRTELGRQIKACAQNPVGAWVSGLNVDHLYAVASGLSAALGALGGGVMATITTVIPERGFEYAIVAVIVSVLGGLGNMLGSLVGGLIMGVVTALCQIFGYSGLAQAVLYGSVFVMMVVRPSGLFGMK